MVNMIGSCTANCISSMQTEMQFKHSDSLQLYMEVVLLAVVHVQFDSLAGQLTMLEVGSTCLLDFRLTMLSDSFRRCPASQIVAHAASH